MRGLIVDLFAGGGGASTGIEAALGRPVDIAINHDPVALAVHKANQEDRRRFAELVLWAPGDACWEWQGCRMRRRNGALSYGLFFIGRKVRILAHRAAWVLVNGPLPKDVVIRHRCDNVACVRPDHLLPGTQAENLADMRERGRGRMPAPRLGTAHHHAKMDPEKVREIRALRADGLSLAKIGSRVGLHASTVHDIVRGKTWAEVA